MARYWDKRAVDLEKLLQDKNSTTIKKVNAMYEKMLKDLNNQIAVLFMTYATKADLDYNEALKLLNQKQTKQFYDHLRYLYNNAEDAETKKEILNRLNAPAYASRISKIEALRDFIYCEAINTGWQATKALQSRLITTYKDSYYQTHYTIQKGTGLAYDFTKLTNPIVKAAIATEWLGSNYSQRIWNNTHVLAVNLENILVNGLMTGKSGQKMAEELDQKMQAGKYATNRVIRTEVNWCAGQARLACYKDADISKYMFVATLDLRTSSICRELDGKVFEVAKARVGVNFPPMHPHCRSVDTAYIDGKDYSKLKRAARNPVTGKTEYVPKNMTYKEWYKKYVANDERAKANERAVKRGLKQPYRYTDQELKDYLNSK